MTAEDTVQAIRYRHATERQYDAAGNTIWIGPRSIEFVPPPNEDPPPGDPLESAAYAGTEQSAIGLDDGDPPPGITTKTFAYNAANRMASVSEDGNLLMSYRYNGAGERVYRSGSGQTAHTVFDPSGRWLGDYDESGQSLQQAIWLGDLPVGLLARLDGGQRQLFYIQPDALGTPRVVIDPTRGAQGVAVWRWELEDEAFGDTEPNQDPDGDNTLFVLDMRYPGQQHDSATGFNYNYFRDYDASTGRYVQSDPIGLGGVSTYGYVDGNPLLIIDPLGLEGVGGWTFPEGPQRDWLNRPRAQEILLYYYNEMKRTRIKGPSDQVFHCMAACRAKKAGNNVDEIRWLLNRKENVDFARWMVGSYGKDLNELEMHQDNEHDRGVNETGLQCPPDVPCAKQCKPYIDALPPGSRALMNQYLNSPANLRYPD